MTHHIDLHALNETNQPKCWREKDKAVHKPQMQRLRLITAGIILNLKVSEILEADRRLAEVRKNGNNAIQLAVWASEHHNIYRKFWQALSAAQYQSNEPSQKLRKGHIESLKPRVQEVWDAMVADEPVPHVRHWREIEEVVRKIYRHRYFIGIPTKPIAAPQFRTG